MCETSQFGVSDHGLILWLYTPPVFGRLQREHDENKWIWGALFSDPVVAITASEVPEWQPQELRNIDTFDHIPAGRTRWGWTGKVCET